MSSIVVSLIAVPCAICGKPVPIAECKTNEIGEPAHESCYAERVKEEIKRSKIGPNRRGVLFCFHCIEGKFGLRVSRNVFFRLLCLH